MKHTNIAKVLLLIVRVLVIAIVGMYVILFGTITYAGMSIIISLYCFIRSIEIAEQTDGNYRRFINKNNKVW